MRLALGNNRRGVLGFIWKFYLGKRNHSACIEHDYYFQAFLEKLCVFYFRDSSHLCTVAASEAIELTVMYCE